MNYRGRSLKRIKSGIYGLDPIIDGGIIKNSVTIVYGSAGIGKTTFATQFLLRGLENGFEGIYITMEEDKDQILKGAEQMGWDEIYDFVDLESLIFIEARGKDFTEFIRTELATFVAKWEGGSDARIVIDPLTPVMWALDTKYEQRETVSFLFKQMKKIGTVVCTLEEHASSSNFLTDDAIIPTYLADSVIHITRSVTDNSRKELNIIKLRHSWHSEQNHIYHIIKGMGLVIAPIENEQKKIAKIQKKSLDSLKRKLRTAPKKVKDRVNKTVSCISESDIYDFTPAQLISMILREYEIE